MFSRTATGLMAAPATEVGTSALAAVTGLELADGAAAEVALGLAEPAVPLAPADLAAVAAPATGFVPGVTPAAGFAVALPAGLGLAAAAPAAELGAGAAAGLAADGLAAEVVGGAAFELDAASETGFGVEAPAGLELVFAAAGPAVELGTDAGAGLELDADGFAAEVWGGAAFDVCALGAAFADGAAWFAVALFVPAAELPGAG